jgi:uncharacterized protein (TIGR02611 family)
MPSSDVRDPDLRSDAPGRAVLRRAVGFRDRVRANPAGRVVWRVAITVLGVGIIGVGIALLPLPGPGWLIIFAGLGLLATEYEWAARLLRLARRQVAAWTAWVRRQNRVVQVLVGVAGVVLLAGVLALSYFLVIG